MLKQIDDIQSITTEKVIGTQIHSQDGHYNVMFAYEIIVNRYAQEIEAGYSYFAGIMCRVNHNTAEEAQDYANKIINTNMDYNDYLKHKEAKNG